MLVWEPIYLKIHTCPQIKTVGVALRGMVQSGGKDHVREVIKQLMHRLKAATDWLVTAWLSRTERMILAFGADTLQSRSSCPGQQ